MGYIKKGIFDTLFIPDIYTKRCVTTRWPSNNDLFFQNKRVDNGQPKK